MTVAIGFFDGVHRGHQAILEGADAAITFSNHPLTILRPEAAPRLILPLRDKIEAISKCGVEKVIVLDFTREMAAISAHDFALNYLKGYDCVRCGENWRFGRGGEGTPESLSDYGIKATIIPYEEHSGCRISSSAIRRALAEGDLACAQGMLGRDISFSAGIKPGKGMGEALGYPTVNLDFEDFVPSLANGVYSASLDGARGVANFGFAPTMGSAAWKEPVMEINLFEPPKRLPRLVHITLHRYLRPERHFESIEALKRQIALDRKAAQE